MKAVLRTFSQDFLVRNFSSVSQIAWLKFVFKQIATFPASNLLGKVNFPCKCPSESGFEKGCSVYPNLIQRMVKVAYKK